VYQSFYGMSIKKAAGPEAFPTAETGEGAEAVLRAK
jgi:hypothetical protein